MGWSLGGLVAQQVALAAPERVSRLVLVNSTPCFVQRPDWSCGIARPVLRRFAEELRQDHRAVLKRFIALEVHGSEHASAQLHRLKAMLFQHGQPNGRRWRMVWRSWRPVTCAPSCHASPARPCC